MSQTTNLGLFKHDNPATNTNAFDVKSALNDNWDKIDNSYGETLQTVDIVSNNVNNLNTQINTEISNRQNADNALEQQINGLASGSPLVANSVSEMTNTNKIYVNTSDGNWYYYNGNAWISGGIYQATQNIINENELNYFQNNYVKTSRNLLTIKEDLTLMANKNWVLHNSFKTTKLIPIDDTKTYLFKNMLSYYFTKAQHIYIFEYTSQTATPTLLNGNNAISVRGDYIYTPTTSTKFIRITYRILEYMIDDESLDINNIISNYDGNFDTLDYLFFGIGTTYTLPEKRYYNFINNKNEQLNESGDNLINKNDLLSFNYSSYNVRYDLYPRYKTTNLIKLNVGQEYTISLDNGNIIAYLKFLNENLIFQTEAGISLDVNNINVNNYTFVASYPFLIITTTQINDLMLVESDEKMSWLPYVYDNTPFEFLLNKINNIPISTNSLNNKNILFAGDSICYGYSYRNGYAGIIQQRENIVYTNIAISGTTIAKRNNRSDSILENVQNNQSTNYDFVIVEGGINDGGSANITIGNITEGYDATLNEFTYCGAMESLCKTLLTKYYNTKVGFVFCHNVKNRTNQNSYFEKGIEICKKWGVPYIDLRNYMNCNVANIADNYTSDDNNDNIHDGLHPNENGYKKYYAPIITNFIKTL